DILADVRSFLVIVVVTSSACGRVKFDVHADGAVAVDGRPSDGSAGCQSVTVMPPVKIPTGSLPRDIAVGDFNGDGHLDLVTGNEGSSTMSVLLGNGDGTFRPKVDYPTNSQNWSIAVADLNG